MAMTKGFVAIVVSVLLMLISCGNTQKQKQTTVTPPPLPADLTTRYDLGCKPESFEPGMAGHWELSQTLDEEHRIQIVQLYSDIGGSYQCNRYQLVDDNITVLVICTIQGAFVTQIVPGYTPRLISGPAKYGSETLLDDRHCPLTSLRAFTQ